VSSLWGKEDVLEMSEQARRVKNKAIPERAQGLYYKKGLFAEALLYHDDEALYFEVRGKDSGVVRFSFEISPRRPSRTTSRTSDGLEVTC
jgi:hypothetical protein